MPTLRDRVAALEATSDAPESAYSYVAVRTQSRRLGAAPWADADVARAFCGGLAAERAPGEPLAALCARAIESAGPWPSGSVPVVLLSGAPTLIEQSRISVR